MVEKLEDLDIGQSLAFSPEHITAPSMTIVVLRYSIYSPLSRHSVNPQNIKLVLKLRWCFQNSARRDCQRT